MYALIDNVKDEYSQIYIFFSRPSYLEISGRGLLLKVTWADVLSIYQHQSYRLDDETKTQIERHIIIEYLAGKSRPQNSRYSRCIYGHSSTWSTRIATYIPTFFI